MGFVDTHVHLHFPDYKEDQLEVMRRAQEAGVDIFINVGTDLESSHASLALAEQYDNVYATAGIHPHDAKDANPEILPLLEELLKSPRMVAIGEVGLDFFRDHSPKEKQKEVLRYFVRLHKQTGKPLVIHCRDAYEDMLELFKEESKDPFQGVMHCFSSDKAVMKQFLDIGFYISFAGPLTYKKNDVLRQACAACPVDRLLLETDAPFLPPQSVRGKRNESSYMLETAQVAADLHGLTLQEIGEKTSANARAVFHL